MTSTKRNTLLIVAAIIALGLFLTQCTYIPTAPAVDFGVGAIECAATYSPKSANSSVLVANGWKKRDSLNGSDRYERSDVKVKLILIEGMPGCLVQGIAEGDDQFPAIVEAVSKALKTRYGKQFQILDSASPNEQAYQTGDIQHILSAKKIPDGYRVRVVSVWG